MRTREQIAARKQAWADRNRERVAALKRAHYLANRAAYIERARKRRETHRDEILEKQREHSRINSAKIVAKVKAWRKANPERARVLDQRTSAMWRSRNPEKVKASNARPAETLSDTYIIRRFHWGSQVKFTVPVALIEAKRVQLQLKRLIQQNSQSL